MPEITIYAGYYKTGRRVAVDVFPELKLLCERELISWGKDHWRALDNTWVNNHYLLCDVPAECLVVRCPDGFEYRFSDHPGWARWKDEFSVPEYYTMDAFHGIDALRPTKYEPAKESRKRG